MPTLVLLAGPDGAGKTTFIDRFLKRRAETFVFVNPDEVARDFVIPTPCSNTRDRLPIEDHPGEDQMLKRVLAIAAVVLALAACVPAGGVPGAGFLGTFGQPTGDHPSRVGAVITRVDAGAGAAQAGGCSAAPTGVCGGCTAVCPVGRPAQCMSGVTRYAAPGSGGASTCTREAVCACG